MRCKYLADTYGRRDANSPDCIGAMKTHCDPASVARKVLSVFEGQAIGSMRQPWACSVSPWLLRRRRVRSA